MNVDDLIVDHRPISFLRIFFGRISDEKTLRQLRYSPLARYSIHGQKLISSPKKARANGFLHFGSILPAGGNHVQLVAIHNTDHLLAHILTGAES